MAACGSSGSSKATGSSGSTPRATPGVSTATPKNGGTLNIGVEAEDNGFNPTIASWDVTGLIYGAAIFDPLTYVGADGSIHPYLAQSITPNTDYTAWTIKVRPGVHFHDGTLCDSSAIVGSLEANLHSPQNGLALTNVARISNPDAATVVVTMNHPWVAFPYYLTAQVGVVMAPAMLSASDHGNRNPIGTGPFRFSDWVPNDHLRVTRNPNYWRSGLPHLDTVVFHPIPDHQSRENSLRAGTVDIIHTTDTQTAVNLMHDASFQYINDVNNNATEHEQSFYVVNCEQPPLDDVRVRTALAHAIDRKRIIDTLLNGLPPDSTGPYSKGSPYFVETGYPSYDPVKAKSMISQLAAEKGGPISFELSTVNDAKVLATTQLVQAMLAAAGVQTKLVQVQQSQYIVQALLGKFAVLQARLFAAADPDVNYIWWHSSTVAPIGHLALNAARNKDPQIDAALDQGRTSADRPVRIAAYQSVSRRLAVDIPNLWISQTLWSVIAKTKVMNFNNPVLPDGSKGLSMTGGFIHPAFIWLG